MSAEEATAADGMEVEHPEPAAADGGENAAAADRDFPFVEVRRPLVRECRCVRAEEAVAEGLTRGCLARTRDSGLGEGRRALTAALINSTAALSKAPFCGKDDSSCPSPFPTPPPSFPPLFSQKEKEGKREGLLLLLLLLWEDFNKPIQTIEVTVVQNHDASGSESEKPEPELGGSPGLRLPGTCQ